MSLKEFRVIVIISLFHCISCYNTDFDHFVFAQQWPRSVCIDSGHTCSIPEEVRTWTVHGLWPTRGDTEDPIDCNSSWVFNYTKIESLKTNLTAQWPNLYTDTKPSEFWAHEWSKHGTCATSLEATDNEYRYFYQGLKINLMINLGGVLEKNGIVPDQDTGYSVKNIADLLSKYYNTNAALSCVYDKEVGRQYLLQVEVCLDKNFHFIHCKVNRMFQLLQESYCRDSELVYILPLHDNKLYFHSYRPKFRTV